MFVLNKNQKPLMPTNPAKARILLKTGKAKVVSRIPFTIKLTYHSGSYTQPVIAEFKREFKLKLPKTHYNDGMAIYCSFDQIVTKNPVVYFKKHVIKGDYQQTTGKRSEKKIPTGKLFGLRKLDLIKTEKGVGIVKGKRSTGYFAITDIFGNKIHDSVNVKRNCERLRARTTTLIEQKVISLELTHSSPTCRATPSEEGVSCL